MNHRQSRVENSISDGIGPYTDYKDSGIEWLGRIPVHWEVATTKRLCHITNGGTPKSSEPRFWDGEVIWITPEDLGNLQKRGILSSKRKITSEGQQNSSATIIPAESLVLSTRAPIGHIGIAGVSLCTNQGCRGLVFRQKCSEVYHYFQFLAYRSALKELGQGSTFNELSTDSLGSFKIGLPPLREQRAIAAFLDRETAEIDALVAKKERLIELLQEKRSALISHAVTRGLDPNVPLKDSGVEWMGKIPAHWEVNPIGALARTGYRTFTDGDWIEAPYITKIGIRLIQTGNIGIGHYKEQGFRYVSDDTFRTLHCTEVIPGDILICRLADPVGRACLAPDLACRMITSVDVCILKPRQNICPSFVVYALSASDYLGYIGAICRGGTRDRVSRSMLGSIRFRQPPLVEQRAIVNYLDRETGRIDALVAKIREAIDRLKERRQAIIFAAVTGEIDVRDPV